MAKVKTICGIDEAGRGALAGPLVCAAVVLPKGWFLESVSGGAPVRDSKKLTANQRETLFRIIAKYALKVKKEIITVGQINRFGVGWANRIAFQRLVLRLEADEYICDGILRLRGLREKTSKTRSMIDADELVPAAICAGIVAKVERDRLMNQLHLQYPRYGWKTNTGHGTKQHLEAILKFGTTNFHRRQFVKTALNTLKEKQKARVKALTSP